MEADNASDRYAHIPGWGVDSQPGPRSSSREEAGHALAPGEPEQQVQTVEVLCSNERDSRITPVFGSTVPPRGVSGMVRRGAFRYSENDLRHWLMLLLADRTDAAEGVLEDLRRGHVPNLVAEMGLRSAWKYDRERTARKLAVALGAAGFLAVLAWRRRSGRD